MIQHFCLLAHFRNQMVKRKTVEGWGFSCLGYEIDKSGKVMKIFCKTCREFYSLEKEQNELAAKCKGSEKFLEQSNAYVDGTHVIKKVNFEKHLTFEKHKKADLRLRVKQRSMSAQLSSTENNPTSGSRAQKQSLLQPMTAAEWLQQGRKFQLAYFTSSNAKLSSQTLQCLKRNITTLVLLTVT